MAATLFQAAQDGNVELVSSLLEEPSLDIDARDETGLTALHHAVRGNHVDVVSQLLAKGANAVEVAEDATLKQNPELASVINNAMQHTQSAAFQAAPVVDSHGGKQLPDGTVSYVQPPSYHGQPADGSMQQQQQHAYSQHSMSQPAYGFQPQHAFFDPSHNPEQRSHAHKDSSSGSLPPPEVARLIPCRFFPNCRYAEKCIFAHPVAMPTTANNAGPVSPGQAPMFYQSHPYGYPAYGPPQHFYSMAPPMPMQYGHGMPVHMPPGPHMGPGPHSSEQTDAYGNPFVSQSRQAFAANQAQEGESENATNEASQKASASTDADADKATTSDESNNAAGSSNEAAKSSAPESSTTTTSFSAFMAHHAAPFQPGPGAPNGVVGADGSVLNGAQSFSRGTKAARRGGASMSGSFGTRTDFSKRSSERPACHFFARSACKHAEDCRFPHILPDGTDARGHNAGRSTHSIEASRAINRALAAKNARGSSNGNNGAQSSQGSNTMSNGDHNGSAAPTNVTASTSMASAQTTITHAQKAEGAKADKAAAKEETAEKSSAASTSAPAAAASAAKKEQTNAPKSSAANGAASSSTPKAAAANGPPSAKTDGKTENVKRPTSKAEESKPTSSLPNGANGNGIPASVPSKPIVNGNGNGSQPNNKQNGSKPQANSVQNGKSQQQNQNGARARTNQGTTGRANGQAGQNGAAPKKTVPQRLPSADDFPALAGQAGAASSAPASSATGVAKPNFSAILSAPAPVKKQPEHAEKPEAASSEDKAAPAADSEAKEASASSTETETKPATAKQTSANGTAAPMLDFAAVVQSNPVAV